VWRIEFELLLVVQVESVECAACVGARAIANEGRRRRLGNVQPIDTHRCMYCLRPGRTRRGCEALSESTDLVADARAPNPS
jgi:hypothetical protein